MTRDTAPGAQGGHYDAVPYDSMPFQQTRPESLGAIATLFGLRPAAAERCRVLELGCASGGNLIPMALASPDARFEGVDLSARQVAMGQARIEVLGLRNITVRQGDVADPDLVSGEFDYIVCHGLFSWVPRPVQDAVLALCGRHLAPGGIFYCSYNVLPGWRQRGVIRDVFRRHTPEGASPLDRVARGRWLLDRLAEASNAATPYGQLLRHEAQQLARMPDSYIVGEFLSDENEALYFSEFAARARAAGLAYLADTDLHSARVAAGDAEAQRLVEALAGQDADMAEQYLDLFHGRQFRQSLLVRAEAVGPARPTMEARRLAPLHFSSRLRMERAADGQAMVLRDPAGPSITTNDPAFARAMEALGQCWPETRSLRELLDLPGVADGADRNAVAERLLQSLLSTTVAGLTAASTRALRIGRAGVERPLACPLARIEAAAGQAWVTSLRHAPVRPGPFAMTLLPLLDGRHDRAALAALLVAAVRGGAVQPGALGLPLDMAADDPALAETIPAMVDRAIADLAALALLLPG